MKEINFIDENYSELVHILPEILVEIPFEVFRGFKRG